MPTKLLTADEFRTAAKDGERPEGMLFKFSTTEPETVGEVRARTKRFVFSDATVDHSDDSIDPKGWQLDVFESNPVALFSHMSWDPPIGRASNVKVSGGKLAGDIEFAPPEVYDFADTIYRLVDGGYLKAVSVGFLPKKWSFSNDKDRPYGIDFKEQLLLEISVCPVPCNPAALGEARSVGIDTSPLVEWAEKVLDSGETVFMPRKDLEALRGQAGAVERRFYIQSDKALSAEAAGRVRDAVKGWQADPSEVLVLEPGFTLRTVGDAPAATTDSAEDEPAVETGDDAETLEAAVAEALKTPTPEAMKLVVSLATKAGRRVSAATKAKLQQALDHAAAGKAAAAPHDEAMTKCIEGLMGEPDDEEPDDDEDPDELTPEPPGSDVPEYLSPEERRMKEARELRASLPLND
jgi:HK97 family phage prohead protease